MNLRIIFKFLSTSAVIQAFNLLLSFAVIKWLSLTELGRYNIGKSIAGTFQYANLGYRYGLDRRLPESTNDELNSLRLSICIYINTGVSCLILLFITLRYGFNWFYIIYGSGGAFISGFTLIRVYFRGTDKLNYFISSSFYGGIIPIAFPILGLILFGLTGLAVSFFIVSLMVFIFYLQKIKLKPIKEVWLQKQYSLIFFKVGSIIYLTNFFQFLANNFDRFFIEAFSGLATVGEYGIIILVFSLSIIVPGSVVEMFFPQYIKDKRNKKAIMANVKKHIKMNLLLILPFICLAYVLLPYVVPLIFEKYSYLVEPMQITLIALIPYIFLGPIYCLLFAFDRHKQILLSNVIASILYFTLLYIALSNNSQIITLVYLKISYTFSYLLVMGIFLFLTLLKNKAIFNNGI
ncbi:hypothetical protein JMN32_26360 [Fulvivirga sp. 29W222]|uniref:Polysaccharide biosynthesis protein n=1 Tax=Fulvivirga marina TaxID=2494733 RepID=A0A937G3R0_9BACT|nr:hypothetical protein [Fulvivirga marina]MBL6449863.1 hypothetical protein [Fulvivirga marina]